MSWSQLGFTLQRLQNKLKDEQEQQSQGDQSQAYLKHSVRLITPLLKIILPGMSTLPSMIDVLLELDQRAQDEDLESFETLQARLIVRRGPLRSATPLLDSVQTHRRPSTQILLNNCLPKRCSLLYQVY